MLKVENFKSKMKKRKIVSGKFQILNETEENNRDTCSVSGKFQI